MKRRQPPNPSGEDSQLIEALAILISSTHSRTRPLPLTKIAQWLQVAVDKLGSYEAVAQRIGLSSKMLRQFSYVSRLPGSVQRMFDMRELDSIDALVHIAMLPKDEQQVVAKALALREIDTGDIRAVVQLRRYGDSSAIESLLARVKRSKTKREYVAEFAVRGSPNRARLLRALNRYIPSGEILRLQLDGALGSVALTPKGKRALTEAARALGVPLKGVIPRILQDEEQS